jgi:hypothetical protein
MSLIFSDPNSAGPFNTFQDKTPKVRVFKLTNANYTTGGTTALVGVLPADASILSMSLWTKTVLSGNSVSAATISVGSASSGTQFVNANAAGFAASGVKTALSPITGIMQPYALPPGNDIQLWVTGTATTGNPTAGEQYLEVTYVR